MARAALPGLLLLFGSFSCEEESAPCSRPGDEWCEENQIVACLDERSEWFVRGDPIFEVGVDCSDYGGTCVEWDDIDGLRVAGCSSTEESCLSEGESMCSSDEDLLYCEPVERFVTYSCQGGYCVEDDDGQGVCAFDPGHCVEGVRMCSPDDSHLYFACSNGAWANQHSCYDDDESCVQFSETEMDCVVSDADGGC
jgi:hypothetical protein